MNSVLALVMSAALVSAVHAETKSAAVAPKPAAVIKYYFSTICNLPICKPKPDTHPQVFGPFTTLAQCQAAYLPVSRGPLGQYPHMMTSCHGISM